MGDNMKVLITGARSGIGYNTGIYLLKKGYEVVFSVHRESEIDPLKEKLTYLHLKNYSIIKLDITNSLDRKKVINLDIDILLLNASIGIGGSLLDMDICKIKENFDVNVLANLELSRIFLGDLFIKGKIGKIIFISSLVSNFPINYLGSYCISKASVKMMVKVLKKELKLVNKEIDIKMIEPGIYNTGFNDVMFNYINEEKISLEKKKLFKKMGSNNLNLVSKTIYKSINDNSNKLIYRTSIIDSIIVKIYHLFFS